MKSRKVYQIEADGVVMPKEYNSQEEAVSEVMKMMESENSKKEYEIMRVEYTDLMCIRSSKK